MSFPENDTPYGGVCREEGAGSGGADRGGLKADGDGVGAKNFYHLKPAGQFVPSADRTLVHKVGLIACSSLCSPVLSYLMNAND